jgi:hypothetical protein
MTANHRVSEAHRGHRAAGVDRSAGREAPGHRLGAAAATPRRPVDALRVLCVLRVSVIDAFAWGIGNAALG